MNGWSSNVDTDNSIFRTACVNNKSLDIIGVAETHLRNENVIELANYIWFGHNRDNIHSRARSGSGGVGFLVSNNILEQYNVIIADQTYEGILWIQLTGRVNVCDTFWACVCYLPPEGSTRNVNVHDFYDTLLSHVLTIPVGNDFFICGDFNSRCANGDDFIRGVDMIPDRDVIDFRSNSFGDVLCDFLINANLCILNGRNTVMNDFTYVSTRGLSVVDYCLVPYESLDKFNDFNVIRASSLASQVGVIGMVEPRVVPDHSLLEWKFDVIVHDYSDNNPCSTFGRQIGSSTCLRSMKYDNSYIPPDFLTDTTTLELLRDNISKLETSERSQLNVDTAYDNLCTIIKSQMDEKLHKIKITVPLNSVNSNKRRRVGKPWWNDELSSVWNDVCRAEKDFIKARKNSCGASKNLKSVFVNKRNFFDRMIQKQKRKYMNDFKPIQLHSRM